MNYTLKQEYADLIGTSFGFQIIYFFVCFSVRLNLLHLYLLLYIKSSLKEDGLATISKVKTQKTIISSLRLVAG